MLWVGKRLGFEHPGIRQAGASHALRVLFLINLCNFADRYVPASVKSLIQTDLNLSDFETTLPSTGMIVVYMIFAVIFGTLADKEMVDRRFMLCGAIIFWSAATALAGLSANLVQLVCLRALIGIGEAAYGTLAPPWLSDFFPEQERNVVYGIYYLAIPVGAALGYGIGAVLGQAFGWREAFYGIGIPGLFVALSVLTLNDPRHGISEQKAPQGQAGGGRASKVEMARRSASASASAKVARTANAEGEDANNGGIYGSANASASANVSATAALHAAATVWAADVSEILRNKAFVCALAGQILNNFSLGGLADWMSTYLIRFQGADVASAGLIVGAATVVGGIGGNILGAKVADYYRPRWKSAYFLVPALFVFPATLCMLLVVNIQHNMGAAATLLFFGNVLTWTYTAPISSVSITVIPPRLRATSCGVLIFLQHILGDIISPPIIGAISDKTGSLRDGLQIAWIALGLSGVVWALGWAFLPDLAQYEAKAAAGGEEAGAHWGGGGTALALVARVIDGPTGSPLFIQAGTKVRGEDGEGEDGEEAMSAAAAAAGWAVYPDKEKGQFSPGEGEGEGEDGSMHSTHALTSQPGLPKDSIPAPQAPAQAQTQAQAQAQAQGGGPIPSYASLLCGDTDPLVVRGGVVSFRS